MAHFRLVGSRCLDQIVEQYYVDRTSEKYGRTSNDKERSKSDVGNYQAM